MLAELDFGVDSFQKPKVLSMKDSVAQIILNLFMMRPGTMPSLPDVGIDIRSYLYRLEEDINVEELKKKIFEQCSEVLSFISLGDVQVLVVPHQNQSILLIILPITGMGDEEDEALLMGFSQDENNQLLFNYQFENGLSFN